jgi:predicted peroxiredoxin
MKQLIIVVTTLDMENVAAIADVFDGAKVASDDYHVEIILTGESGIIATIQPMENGLDVNYLCLIYESMRSAKSAGVKLNICERAIEWCRLNNDEIIPEIDSIVNSRYIIERYTSDTYVTYV